MVHAGVKDVRDLLGSSNYNFVTYTLLLLPVSALIKTGKMFPSQNLTPLIKEPPKTSSLQQKLSDHFQKKDFIASEKPGKVAF